MVELFVKESEIQVSLIARMSIRFDIIRSQIEADFLVID